MSCREETLEGASALTGAWNEGNATHVAEPHMQSTAAAASPKPVERCNGNGHTGEPMSSSSTMDHLARPKDGDDGDDHIEHGQSSREGDGEQQSFHPVAEVHVSH